MRTTLQQRSAPAGFTMIEVALSIAIVGFALVAIMGILPTGMTVEKDNREDTMMSQEGRYWLEALRSGSAGMYDLTNFVEEIKIVEIKQETGGGEREVNWITNSIYLDGTNFTSSLILRQLTLAKYTNDLPFTNITFRRITARVRPITGNAADVASSFTNAPVGINQGFAGFRYEIQTEVVPELTFPLEAFSMIDPNATNEVNRARQQLASSIRNIRLTLRYPLIERGNNQFAVGSGRKHFRAKFAGGRDQNGIPQPNVFAHLNP